MLKVNINDCDTLQQELWHIYKIVTSSFETAKQAQVTLPHANL